MDFDSRNNRAGARSYRKPVLDAQILQATKSVSVAFIFLDRHLRQALATKGGISAMTDNLSDF